MSKDTKLSLITTRLGIDATNVKAAVAKVDSLITTYEDLCNGELSTCKEQFQAAIADLRQVRAELTSMIGRRR